MLSNDTACHRAQESGKLPTAALLAPRSARLHDARPQRRSEVYTSNSLGGTRGAGVRLMLTMLRDSGVSYVIGVPAGLQGELRSGSTATYGGRRTVDALGDDARSRSHDGAAHAACAALQTTVCIRTTL